MQSLSDLGVNISEEQAEKILKRWEWCCNLRSLMHLKQHYVTLTATRGFEKRNLTMHVNMSHKTILEKTGHIFWRWCPTTALPQLCGSRGFLKATCILPADRSCSCSSGQLVGTAPPNKRLQTDRTVVEHHCASFSFSKPRVAVKVT